MNKVLLGLVGLAAAALIACRGADPSGSVTTSGGAVQEACVYTFAPSVEAAQIARSIATDSGPLPLKQAIERSPSMATSKSFPLGHLDLNVDLDVDGEHIRYLDTTDVYVFIPDCKWAEAQEVINLRRQADNLDY